MSADEKDQLAEARARKARTEPTADDEVAEAKRMADLSRDLLRLAERMLERRTRKDEE